MFYLAGQIALFLLVAFGLGLLTGWLVWGRREGDVAPTSVARALPARSRRGVPPAVVPAAPPPAPAAHDDLERISGVGPTVAGRLAELGLVTYRQIAQLSDDDLARVAPLVGYTPERIGEEGWRESAARLHRETHGGEP